MLIHVFIEVLFTPMFTGTVPFTQLSFSLHSEIKNAMKEIDRLIEKYGIKYSAWFPSVEGRTGDIYFTTRRHLDHEIVNNFTLIFGYGYI